mgnify:CR=1
MLAPKILYLNKEHLDIAELTDQAQLHETIRDYLEDVAPGFVPGLSRRLENCIYLHFSAKGYKVHVGNSRKSTWRGPRAISPGVGAPPATKPNTRARQ